MKNKQKAIKTNMAGCRIIANSRQSLINTDFDGCSFILCLVRGTFTGAQYKDKVKR